MRGLRSRVINSTSCDKATSLPGTMLPLASWYKTLKFLLVSTTSLFRSVFISFDSWIIFVSEAQMSNRDAYYLLKIIYIFIYGCTESSLYADFLQFWCMGFSFPWLLLLHLKGSRAHVQQLWCMGLVALWHLGSSWTRDGTCVPCIGSGFLTHWTTVGVLQVLLNLNCLGH